MYSPTVSGLRSQLDSAEMSAAFASSDAFRARRAAAAASARAADEGMAAAIYQGAASGHAAVAMELRSQLSVTRADRDRLQDIVDDMVIERSTLLAHCASLLLENAPSS